MIDTTLEELIPLAKAGAIANPAHPPHVATIWRWALHGVSGVILESIKIGGVRQTSREAVARFIARLNEPGAVPEPANRAAEAAGARLAAKGV